jgi:hypothetical protein
MSPERGISEVKNDGSAEGLHCKAAKGEIGTSIQSDIPAVWHCLFISVYDNRWRR